MYSYTKDGILVASMLDTRKLNSKGTYPIKIRVTNKRVRAYYSTGTNLSVEEWEKLPNNKSNAYKEIKESIENCFSLVKTNVEALAEKGIFSFDALNVRMGKATGDNLNNALRAKIDLLMIRGSYRFNADIYADSYIN